MHTNLKRAPNFLKIYIREKEQNSLRDVFPVLKHHSLRIQPPLIRSRYYVRHAKTDYASRRAGNYLQLSLLHNNSADRTRCQLLFRAGI